MNRSPLIFALSILPLFAGCASSTSPELTAAEAAPALRVSDAIEVAPAEVARPPQVNSADPSKAPPPAKPLTDETKKKIEEYKALALKNDCSSGYQGLPGTWRFVGETKTPNYSDTLVVTGTRFKEALSGNPDGRFLAAEIEGEIRCVFKNRVLVQLDKVTPEGAYGNQSGDVYPCDMLSDMDPTTDRMLMICYFDWDLRTAAGMEFEYERVEVKKAP